MKSLRFPTWSSLLLAAGVVFGLSACGTTNDAALGTGSMTAWTNDNILQTYITLNQGEVLTSQRMAGADTVAVDDEADVDVHAHMDIAEMDMSDIDTPEEFARMMVVQHGNAIQHAVVLSGNTALEPTSNPASRSLENTAQNIADQLQSLSGEQLDAQYMQDQIRLHQNALVMLDNTLIPNATDPQLRQMLEQGRQIVATHLQVAQRIQADIQNDTSVDMNH